MTSYGALENRQLNDEDSENPDESGLPISASLPRLSSFLSTDYVDPNSKMVHVLYAKTPEISDPPFLWTGWCIAIIRPQ
ncbi:hypothetical protein L596_004946 [Steinernema carpocapsae]|uniref:Uncharacterized protein n=1 Tax=Steinernema carpocapsae TaxID=34508 RepID=A0A4U8UXF4_STECR|nr:hypothetical protein L596_004946 [Steinernema carpocapsae]